ncbi:hypothetical protein FGE12_26125 [Aggregicoccus sp. 17bor-14]|uniref:hypothetical protein n=1 Tax=Myxococcaceae TaxID=31 RepID=UPI00129C5025|nr:MULTISPECIES: hypothetical protein [Myxococcaceae]MBF5045915.1 hypothetical protein [Simulacricoccus sp. 17bor-14]MRI91649.1 hypothetical protein [Aggregicoccus sp. 17bor-14]
MRPSALLASLALPLLLAAPSAEARFGKRSSSEKPAAEKPAQDDAPHAATPPGEEPERYEGRGSDRPCRDCDGGSVVAGLLFNVFAPPHATRSHLHVEVNEAPTRSYFPVTLTLGLEGLALPRSEGGGAAARLALEGARWGVSFRVLGLGLRADDGSNATDNLSLADAQLTYALVAMDRVRLRLEAGVNAAHGPDVDFLSPAFGSSLEACVAGPLDVEARLQLVPFPDRVLDAQAGLMLHLGAFALHGGWRGLVLDDAGYVDGVRHTDALGGPYVGASVVF